MTVVVGGGVTDLTASYLLAKAGKQVVLVERGRDAITDTGHTSVHRDLGTIRDATVESGMTRDATGGTL